MRQAFKELKDDIARYFGYIPKDAIKEQLKQIDNARTELTNNISVFQKQQATVETIDMKPRVYEILIYNCNDVVSLYIGVESKRNQLGRSDFIEPGDIISTLRTHVCTTSLDATLPHVEFASAMARELSSALQVPIRYSDGTFKGVPEKIIGSAIKVDNIAYWLPAPNRHHNVHRMLDEVGVYFLGKEVQGFWTSLNRFVDRKEGLEVAKKANQLLERHQHAFELFSESVW